MKNILQQTISLFLLCVLAVPAVAGEMTKGTKTYQARSQQTKETVAKAPEMQTPEDMAAVAPAAGDTIDAPEKDTTKSMREEMRLPRKN